LGKVDFMEEPRSYVKWSCLAIAGLAAVCLLLLAGMHGLGQTPNTPREQPPAPVVNGPLVANLAFISGSWHGAVAGGVFDEEWSTPRAEAMMGMFRYMENGKVKFYEFMAIEAGASGPVLHLRHFDADLAGWEERSKPLSFSVAAFTENQVVFESAGKATRLTYRRSSEDSLTVVLEQSRQGRKGTQEFHYLRAQ
jgi:Domain of unknown function (DUF6265)